MRKQLSKKDISSIKKLHESGMPLMEIAFKKRISFWTIKYHLDPKYKESVMRNNLNRNRAIAQKKKDEE